MIPFITGVEPVTEDTALLQIQVVQLRLTGVSFRFLPCLRTGTSIIGSIGIERTLAELEFVLRVVTTVIRLEDGLMQLSECLVASDFDRTADSRVGELLTDWPTHQEDRDNVEVRRRRCRALGGGASRLVGRTRRSRRLLATVPSRNLVLRDQNLERTGLAGMARISPFFSSIFTIWFTEGGETQRAAAISDSAGGYPCRLM